MQEPFSHSQLERAKLIREQTWKIFRDKYQAKFKKELGREKFIVLASVALIDTQNTDCKIVSVGFGTKSLPQSVIQKNSSEDLLADMHAEILAIRGFRHFLLREVSNKNSVYLERDQKKKKIKMLGKYKIYLYCSEIFCGDCCINNEELSFSGAKPLRNYGDQIYPELKYQPNILRTKPGRLDLPKNKRSPILSCSDLIAYYNLAGIQGKKLFSLFIPIYIETVILQSSQKMRQNIRKGIDFPQRLSILKKRSVNLIERQIFNVIIDGKQRKISSQFKNNHPNLIILQKDTENESRNQEGFELCGIITDEHQEWINGRSGLPEGSSLKTYRTKGKISMFCESKMNTIFPFYKQGDDSFKYEAISYRLKSMFGEWIQDTV